MSWLGRLFGPKFNNQDQNLIRTLELTNKNLNNVRGGAYNSKPVGNAIIKWMRARKGLVSAATTALAAPTPAAMQNLSAKLAALQMTASRLQDILNNRNKKFNQNNKAALNTAVRNANTVIGQAQSLYNSVKNIKYTNSNFNRARSNLNSKLKNAKAKVNAARAKAQTSPSEAVQGAAEAVQAIATAAGGVNNARANLVRIAGEQINTLRTANNLNTYHMSLNTALAKALHKNVGNLNTTNRSNVIYNSAMRKLNQQRAAIAAAQQQGTN